MPLLVRINRARFVPSLLTLLLVLLTLGPGLGPSHAGAKDDGAPVSADAVWGLIPGHASAVITVNTDPASPQWKIAADLLKGSGLEGIASAALDQFVDEANVPASNFRAGQSSILGGTIALATWGDSEDAFGHAAIYIAAADPETAFRSVTAQIISETDTKASEVEIPGGRVATGRNFGGAILLLNDVVVITNGSDGSTIANLVTGAGPTLADFQPFNTVMSTQSDGVIARAYGNGPAAGRALLGLVDIFGIRAATFGAVMSLASPITGAFVSVGLEASADGFRMQLAQLPAPFIGADLPGDGPSTDFAATTSASSDVFVTGVNLGENPFFTQIIDTLVITAAATGGSFPDDPPADIRTWAYDQLRLRTGVDLRSDMIDQLRGDFVMAGASESLDQISALDLVIQSDLDHADSVRQATTKLATLLRVVTSDLTNAGDISDFSETLIGDDTLYTLVVQDDSAGQSMELTFGVLDDHFLVSVGEGRDLLDPAVGQDLASDLDYRAAIDKLPVREGAPLFIDLHGLLDLIGLTTFEPPDDWDLQAGNLVSLDAIQAIAGISYESNGMAMTDLLLTFDMTAST